MGALICSRPWPSRAPTCSPIDWRLPLREARRRLPGRPLQGNLDPGVLLGTPEDVDRRTRRMVVETEGRAHIVNLGHGVLPGARIECVEAFFEAARQAAPASVTAGARRVTGPGDVPLDLLRRYNVPGPRYTSYPTAPVWKEDFGPAELRARISPRSRPGMPLCPSTSTSPSARGSATSAVAPSSSREASHAPESDYLDTLEREIDWVAPPAPARGRSSSFTWGGGTPTYFSPERLGAAGRASAGSILLRGGRGDRRRGGSAGYHCRASRGPGTARLQPALDGRSGLRSCACRRRSTVSSRTRRREPSSRRLARSGSRA